MVFLRVKVVTQLVIKPFGISQTSRIVRLRWKKSHIFPNSFLILIYFLDNTSHKFWGQSPSRHYHCCLQVSETDFRHRARFCYFSSILKHWLGGGAWFVSAKSTIPEFPETFPGIDVVSIIYVRYCRWGKGGKEEFYPSVGFPLITQKG